MQLLQLDLLFVGRPYLMWYEGWVKRDHVAIRWSEILFSNFFFKTFKGLLSAYIAYPIAERSQKRQITAKLSQLKSHYKKPFDLRLKIAEERLVQTLSFAGERVPYYRELYKHYHFNPEDIRRDINYLDKLPVLTKEIIREQGNRMLSKTLEQLKYDVCKTGGSTGPSSVIFYDKEASDFSAATTLFAREAIGKYKWRDSIHFACQFPGEKEPPWPSREDYKCFAMNRSNIFFAALNDEGLSNIWKKIERRRPYMIHAHPSTIYALACYVEKTQRNANFFQVFESSGELLQSYMRKKIEDVFKCKVIDRYGLAEFGVVAYQLDKNDSFMRVLDSEVWPESEVNNDGQHELILTGLRNRLMPLIRYKTGDYGEVKRDSKGFYLDQLVGRIHDFVEINGSIYPTHHIMDIIDHRIRDVDEFQIDLRASPPILRIIAKPDVDNKIHQKKIEAYWPNTFDIQYVNFEDLVRVGRHQKFRHVVHD